MNARAPRAVGGVREPRDTMEPTDAHAPVLQCWGETARRDTAGEETVHATCIGPAGRAASVDRGKEGAEFALRVEAGTTSCQNPEIS
jgi:hypothetical protein